MSTNTDQVKIEIIVDGKSGEVTVKNFGKLVRTTMSEVKESTKESEKGFSGMWAAIAGGMTVGGIAANVVGTLAREIQSTVPAALSAEEGNRRLATTLLNMSAAAGGKTFNSLQEFADSIKNITTLNFRRWWRELVR